MDESLVLRIIFVILLLGVTFWMVRRVGRKAEGLSGRYLEGRKQRAEKAKEVIIQTPDLFIPEIWVDIISRNLRKDE